MLSLQEISDRMEIQILLVNYCDAIDRNDMDKLDSVFIPDAYLSYKPYGGGEGRYVDLKQRLGESLGGFAATQHLIANPDIRVDGDRATGRIMCFNPLAKRGQDGQLSVGFAGLWYIDEYVRTPKGWRIASRIPEPSWQQNFNV